MLRLGLVVTWRTGVSGQPHGAAGPPPDLLSVLILVVKGMQIKLPSGISQKIRGKSRKVSPVSLSYGEHGVCRFSFLLSEGVLYISLPTRGRLF